MGWYDNGVLKYEHFYKKGKRTGTWKNYFMSGNLEFIQPFDDEGRHDGDIIAYYDNGQKRRIESLKNGRNEDGFSYQCWFANGDMEAELKYLNGQMIERKNWNSYGQFVNHEIYDAIVKKLVKVDLSPSQRLAPSIKSKILEVDPATRKVDNSISNYNQKGIWFYLRIIALIILAIRLIAALING